MKLVTRLVLLGLVLYAINGDPFGWADILYSVIFDSYLLLATAIIISLWSGLETASERIKMPFPVFFFGVFAWVYGTYYALHTQSWWPSFAGLEVFLAIPIGLVAMYLSLFITTLLGISLSGKGVDELKTTTTTDPYGDKHAARILKDE